jgi:hypothetical protein
MFMTITVHVKGLFRIFDLSTEPTALLMHSILKLLRFCANTGLLRSVPGVSSSVAFLGRSVVMMPHAQILRLIVGDAEATTKPTDD